VQDPAGKGLSGQELFGKGPKLVSGGSKPLCTVCERIYSHPLAAVKVKMIFPVTLSPILFLLFMYITGTVALIAADANRS
jgi:hypothetical protein